MSASDIKEVFSQVMFPVVMAAGPGWAGPGWLASNESNVGLRRFHNHEKPSPG